MKSLPTTERVDFHILNSKFLMLLYHLIKNNVCNNVEVSECVLMIDA